MRNEPGEAREAAKNASDPDRLLPGEDPESTQLDDAEHWIKVYRELLEYKHRLLEVTEEALSELADEPARREVAQTDRAVITAERERLARRLRFWDRRLAELQP
jgi:hypothetical protein